MAPAAMLWVVVSDRMDAGLASRGTPVAAICWALATWGDQSGKSVPTLTVNRQLAEWCP